MSLAGHFSSKWVNQDKQGREIRTHEDYRAARIRHADGSHADYRGGKIVPGTHTEAPKKETAKKDVASGESKFYKPTPISTLVQKTKDETETVGETETGAHVRKKFDVNAPRGLKL
jgi:hypothetical protein